MMYLVCHETKLKTQRIRFVYTIANSNGYGFDITDSHWYMRYRLLGI
jgi:hypothetical protein